MKVKTSHILWVSLAVVALSQGENMRASVEKGSQAKQEQSDFSDRLRKNRTEARNAEKLSKVALDRYKSNCILVSDQETGKETYLQPGALVVDMELGRPLRTGASVCNRLGDTAVVSAAGTVIDIARVTTTDLPTFKKLMEQRK